MSIALTNLSSSNAIIGSATNDRFDLGTSSGNVINTGKGNDIFYVDPGAADLGGNQLVGGGGINFVEVAGTSTSIDLTRSATANGGPSTGIAAVVAVHYATQPSADSVNVSIAGIATSAVKSANGAAFASVVGVNGVTNIVGGSATFLGEVGATGVGYDANGNVLTAAQTATLVGDETSVASIEGNLAKLFFDDYNLNTATQSYIQNHLNAYIFQSGGKDYTLWSDGQVTLNSGNAYTVGAAATAAPGAKLAAVTTFTNVSAADATLSDNAAGTSTLALGAGAKVKDSGAIVLAKGVSGTIVHGVNGLGGDYFGLGQSGGGNTILGDQGGDQFDLGASTSLQDILRGEGGFNVITAPSAADVDLTSGNATTGVASTGITAVVGSPKQVETVEVDFSNLKTALVGGVRTSVFEAFLGGPSNTVTVSGGTTLGWEEVATIAPGGALPTGATALENASTLDTFWKADGGATSPTTNAEATLKGYVFEQFTAKGAASRFVTLWTDATVVNDLAAPTAAMAQAMARLGASSASVTTGTSTSSSPTASSSVLASPSA
ncbi:MAG TPA: hypothetical protein VHY34_05385 [Caulobacteraceae bacterium]|nr:hypothetical protein [Caulobacteraceae bacterium]